MDTLETNIERDTVEAIFARAVFIPRLSGYLDPFTGDTWPAIRGASDDPDANEDDDDQNDDDDDDEDEDDDAQDEKKLKAQFAKTARSAAKKARTKLARELGYKSVGEMKTALADQDTDEDPEPKKQSKSKPAEKSDGTIQAQRRADVTIAVASSGINPEKIKRASRIVFSDLDGDDFDGSDLEDAIDELRVEEPGWFPEASDDEGDEGKGRSVSGPKPQRRKKKTSVGVAESQAARIKNRNSAKSIFNP